MTFDRSQFASLAERKRNERQDRPRLELVAQAAVKANLLTGSPHWDTFLTYIQSAVDATERQLKGFEAKLSDPAIVNPDDMMRAKIWASECRGRRDALLAVLSLPADLMKAGEAARTVLERLGDA